MRILLSAYACAPDRGSEPGVGWNWAKELSKRHEVWVLTHAAAAPAIRRVGGLPSVNFVFVRGRLPAGGWALNHWLHYYEWQYAAYRAAKRIHQKMRFEIAHQVTYVAWRAPSFLWRLGIPLVWGPIGGGQTVPSGFRSVLGLRGMCEEAIRSLAQRVGTFDLLIRATARAAATILAANTMTAEFLVRRFGVSPLLFPGIALEQAGPHPPATITNTGPTRLLWVGLLRPLKGLPLLLRALPLLNEDVKLTVVGHGREAVRCQALCRHFGVDNRVLFAGWLAREDVQRLYPAADIFIFTSLRDTYGNVLLEAMAAGVPIVALDWAGPYDLLDDACAVKIPPKSPNQVVRDLAAAIDKLAADPDLRRRMGEAGRRRVMERFDWGKKAEEMNDIYNEVASRKS